MVYLKQQMGLFLVAIVCLILGSVGIFAVPIYVGWVITAMDDGKFEDVNKYCI